MNKIIVISFIFFVLSSIQLFSQTSDSLKYYSILNEISRIEDSLAKVNSINSNDSNKYNTLNYFEYDRKGNIKSAACIQVVIGMPTKLIDSITNNFFVLDSMHIFISAYDRTGKELWKTDPYIDNSIKEYRTKRPIIADIYFITDNLCYENKVKKGTKSIWIIYNNGIYGYIDLLTGAFKFCGQN